MMSGVTPDIKERARDVMSGRWIVVAPAHQLLFAQLNIGGNFDELPPK